MTGMVKLVPMKILQLCYMCKVKIPEKKELNMNFVEKHSLSYVQHMIHLQLNLRRIYSSNGVMVLMFLGSLLSFSYRPVASLHYLKWHVGEWQHILYTIASFVW